MLGKWTKLWRIENGGDLNVVLNNIKIAMLCQLRR